jgi:hypothetical protein
MVIRCLREIREAPVVVGRCGTDAKEVLGLWRALERPDLGWFADRLTLVARAAQISATKVFARDVRAEGWPEGADRTNHVGTLTTRKRWADRLSEAEEWAKTSDRVRDGVAYCRRRRWTVKGDRNSWVLLDPYAPLFEEYARIARDAAVGEALVAEVADRRATKELDDSAATTELVRLVIEGGAQEW